MASQRCTSAAATAAAILTMMSRTWSRTCIPAGCTISNAARGSGPKVGPHLARLSNDPPSYSSDGAGLLAGLNCMRAMLVTMLWAMLWRLRQTQLTEPLRIRGHAPAAVPERTPAARRSAVMQPAHLRHIPAAPGLNRGSWRRTIRPHHFLGGTPWQTR